MSDSTAQPQITEEMIEAGAMTLDERIPWDQHTPTGRAFMRLQAAAVLKAALAGRTVVELPEARIGSTGETWWPVHQRGEVSFYRQWDDDSIEVETPHENLSPDDAEAYGLALITAARESRRLACESSGDSDYPRFYRWGDSHFYRVDAPDRVRFRTDERNDWSASGVRTEAELLGASTATFERYHPEQS